MNAPADALAARVLRRLAMDSIPPSAARVAGAVRSEPESAVLGEDTLRRLTERLTAELDGAGPLARLLSEPDVTDVLVNGSRVWVDRGDGLRPTPLDLGGVDRVRRLAQRLASLGGRRLDEAAPFVDARLPDGTRFHAVLPPIARDGPLLSLRTFRPSGFTLDQLVKCGSVSPLVAEILAAVVAARLPYLITGGTGCGKTTILAALLALVPHHERIVVVEDAAELCPNHPHVVALQARMANVEGVGEITLRHLIRQALRMRPDRLVIGECRGAEIVDLLGALNTGHDGGAATLHANAPVDVPARVEALGLLAGVPRAALHAQLAAGLRVVVHVTRSTDGRVVDEICLLTRDNAGMVATAPAWSRLAGPESAFPALAALLAQRGAVPPKILEGIPASATPKASRTDCPP